jgi:hypothetical protein
MSQHHPQALTVSAAIAERLADPSAVIGTDHRGDAGRRPQSLAGGAAGITLLHIERARSGHGDWATAHTWLSVAAAGELSAGSNAGLFFGAPTLAFVAHAAADQPGKLARTRADLDTHTTALTCRRLAEAHARIARGDRPPLAELDLIRGLAGLGAYHLHCSPDHDITQAVLSYLVRLAEPLPGRTDGLPGWWTDLAPTGRSSPDYPGGHGNAGMSHGIAGALALLSLARRVGLTVNGHTDAIDRICAWLDAWQYQGPAGPWWPGIVTLDDIHRGHTQPSSRQRPSWCYGTPGLARAQQLAGLATGDTARQSVAEDAMVGCLDDLARLPDSGLCHGLAGLLQTAWRMAADAHTPRIGAQLPRLTTTLLARPPPTDGPELLDGQAGVALALHTVGTGTAPLTTWDACLLLA